MVEIEKLFTKSEYVNLFPPLPAADYERLKQSIKEQGGLFFPIVINQDKVVLDGHHRLRACKELGVPVSCEVRNFAGRPMDELNYVVAANLDRRHQDLNEFQRAEIGLKMEKPVHEIAAKRKQATHFTRETGKMAAMRRFYGSPRSVIRTENEGGDKAPPSFVVGGRTREQLGLDVGVSSATIARVKTILEKGSQEQIASLRNRRSRPGIKTIYKQIQVEEAKAVGEENLKFLNKDFRIVTQEDIPAGSVDLVLVLNFPAPSITEDEGAIHEQLMKCASRWLKDGGLLAMHVEQRFLPRAIYERPPLLQFHRLLSLDYAVLPFYEHLKEGWRPIVVYVKGSRHTHPTAPQKASSDFIGGSLFSNEQELAGEIIKRLSPRRSTIVDPFMWQSRGMIGMAAMHLGRTYIGIEKDTT
jgi:hypothetical protein